MTACNADACAQGRKPCPCPAACEVAPNVVPLPIQMLGNEPGTAWRWAAVAVICLGMALGGFAIGLLV